MPNEVCQGQAILPQLRLAYSVPPRVGVCRTGHRQKPRHPRRILGDAGPVIQSGDDFHAHGRVPHPDRYRLAVVRRSAQSCLGEGPLVVRLSPGRVESPRHKRRCSQPVAVQVLHQLQVLPREFHLSAQLARPSRPQEPPGLFEQLPRFVKVELFAEPLGLSHGRANLTAQLPPSLGPFLDEPCSAAQDQSNQCQRRGQDAAPVGWRRVHRSPRSNSPAGRTAIGSPRWNR